MGLFDRLGGRQQPQQMQMPSAAEQQRAMQSMRQEIGQTSADPGGYLKGKGYDIPAGMTDAKQITQHLLQTGQVGIPRLNQVAAVLGLGRR